jgi:hypothetical protein
MYLRILRSRFFWTCIPPKQLIINYLKLVTIWLQIFNNTLSVRLYEQYVRSIWSTGRPPHWFMRQMSCSVNSTWRMTCFMQYCCPCFSPYSKDHFKKVAVNHPIKGQIESVWWNEREVYIILSFQVFPFGFMPNMDTLLFGCELVMITAA